MLAIRNSTATQYESYDDLQSELGSLQAAATGAQRTLKKLEQLKEVCPTCKQPIDVSAEKAMIAGEKTKLASAQEKIDEIKPQIIRIKENNAEFERIQKAQKDCEDLLRSFDRSLPTAVLDKEQLEDRLYEIQSRIQKAKAQLADSAAENERRTKVNTRIQVIQELKKLEESAKNNMNVMPNIISCINKDCTLGEISDSLRKIFGEY